MGDVDGTWEPLGWRDRTGIVVVALGCLVFFIGLLTLACYLAGKYSTPIERRIEKQIAWAQFTFDYSENQWCVNAQRRDAAPGEYVGGCWKTLHEAEEGILK